MYKLACLKQMLLSALCSSESLNMLFQIVLTTVTHEPAADLTPYCPNTFQYSSYSRYMGDIQLTLYALSLEWYLVSRFYLMVIRWNIVIIRWSKAVSVGLSLLMAVLIGRSGGSKNMA